MDLSKEIAEFRGAFKDGGVLTRAFLILSFFFSLSSLTSLSSTIVEWKGFIREAINFYQLYFVGSISSVASKVGFSYSRTEIHVSIIMTVCTTVGMRLLALGQKAAFREINARYASELKPNLGLLWFISIAFPVGIWILYGVFSPVIHPWAVAVVFVFYPAALVGPKIIMSKFNYEYFERNAFSYFKSYYAYIFTLLIIIGVLAAINSGLKQGEPNKPIQPITNAPAS